MKSRIALVFLLFVSLFGLLIARAFYLQLVPNAPLAKLKRSQYLTVVQLPSQRGKIVDRRGEELATSIVAHSLYADPTLIQTPKKLAKKLAPLLGLSAKEIYPKLITERRFVWLKRRLTEDLYQDIKSWEEPGLGFIEEGRRAYPNEALLSQVLGLVGAEGEGLEGLERKFDAELKGEKKSILSKRDAHGRPLVVNGQIFETHGDGATLETTIDKELQYELERELEHATVDEMAEKALGVIMDPATGEILAMGSYPSYDANGPNKSNPELRRNRVVQDTFEPGSTFKVVAAAAALKSGRIFPNTKYFCEGGKMKIGKRIIREAEMGHKFDWLSLAEILEVSSNIGITKVAFDVGQPSMKAMMSSFGFGSRLTQDFNGESAGLIQGGDWPEHLFSNISFGHGVGVTALQIASAYATIANGGKMMRPYLVKRIVDNENHPIEERKPEVIRQVLNPKDATTLTMMLSGVTEQGGTGTLARVDGYPVAGKTGTAQKVNPNGRGYLPKSYVSSFAGFVPANNPQFVIYIMVDNPKRHYYGAQVAAPVFHRLASFALHRKGFMPIVVSEKSIIQPEAVQPLSAKVVEALNDNTTVAVMSGVVPDFSGLTVKEVSQRLRAAGGMDAQIYGVGQVYMQSLPPGQKLAEKQKLKIYLR